ncbi:Rib/alpha-like domain-containing protein [Enterococcus faecalis]|uniref:Rib/alpha-like domain-containing protein n=1 Tax=Enterococcus TaxID=1350 RepID=UPI000B3CC432|nr:Rib/alpha-like domain-containing protein [Enterococcus faecalis]ARV02462.1 hypothetical protein A6B47_00635 [Enterococcus faecalis]MBG9436842.1 DUF5011 domain-containing protein [Enterococcus faecalis]MBG9439480.1 DUF5011 domain-containing protein [Enterococcus faecalis]MBG9442398.1 DUF5011 domain-containing protein [Enterococcus faecalis]MDL4974567.1 Rib/alpha-like domain-containing protein [Enterococcus faecalis]
MNKYLKKISICGLFITCLSVGIELTIEHADTVFAQEVQQQKDVYKVSTTNITKNKGEVVNKLEILDAVQTTGFGKVPITKSILKEYEKKLPLTIQNEGTYNFPVQVQYQDGSITEVTVSVIVAHDASVEKDEIAIAKQKLTTVLSELLTLIQENPNMNSYTEASKIAYTTAVANAYEPYKKGTVLVKSPTSTLDDINRAIADVEVHKATITSAKQAFVERQINAEELANFNTLLAQVQTIIETPVKLSDKSADSIANYEEVKHRAKMLLDNAKQKVSENTSFTDALTIFKELKAMKEELLVAQEILKQSTSQAQKYNPKGKEVVISIGSSIDPLNFIENSDAINQLPQGTKVTWTYGNPDVSKACKNAPISITVTYPDGSTDIVPAALTILSEKGLAPSIYAEDKKIIINTPFNALEGVSANDPEDGEIILTKENIKENNVDTSKPGIYTVVYVVTNKRGMTTLKKITVTVLEKEPVPVTKPKATDSDKVNQKSLNNLSLTNMKQNVPFKKATKDSRKLPKTGEDKQSIITISGIIIILSSFIFLTIKRSN